jgi:hypothetical protein
MDKCGFNFQAGKGFVSSLNTGPSSGEKKLFYIQRLKSVLLNLEKIEEYEFKKHCHSQNNQFFIYEEGGKQSLREINYFQNRDNICTDKVNLTV